VLAGVGRGERAIFIGLAPLIKKMMRLGMKIDDQGAERSLGFVQKIFDTVGERLSDGRPFLVGEDFSAADLTFAALAAPVLLPSNYGSPLPFLAELPSEFLAQVEEFRLSSAGAFALRMYHDHR
jgi:glutathione S-transferase